MQDSSKDISVHSVIHDVSLIIDAGKQITRGEATREAFNDVLSYWIENASICSACELIRFGFAQKSDFLQKIPTWIEVATPTLACKMIECGLSDVADFDAKLPFWLKCPKYTYVRDFVMTYSDDDVFSDTQIKKWIEGANLDSAIELMEDGLACREDFLSRISDFISFGPRKRVEKMRRAGILTDKEANQTRGFQMAAQSALSKKNATGNCNLSEGMRLGLIDHVSATVLLLLIEAGIVNREDCECRIRSFIENASVETIPWLVHLGFCDASGMRKKVLPLKDRWTPIVAEALIQNQIILSNDIDDLRDLWRKTISLKTLPSVVRLGIISFEEAINLCKQWGDSSSLWVDKQFSEEVNGYDMNSIRVGQVVIGRVVNVADDVAVVKFADFQSYLVRGDVTWRKNVVLGDVLRLHQILKCVVTKVNSSKSQISVDAKSMADNPWPDIAKSFPSGTKVKGRVVRIQDYGILVELVPSVVGLVHLSEISWERNGVSPNKLFKEGDEIEVVVLSVDVEKERISLSIKRAMPDPWECVAKLCQVGRKIKGKIVGKETFGLFVEVLPGANGLVHYDEISWSDKSSSACKLYAIGDEVEVVITSFDAEKRRIGLSIKQARPSPWNGVEEKYPVGTCVKGIVKKLSKRIAFVELPDGLVAVLYRSETEVDDLKSLLMVGQEIDAQIVMVSGEKQQMSLSMQGESTIVDTVKADIRSLNQ